MEGEQAWWLVLGVSLWLWLCFVVGEGSGSGVGFWAFNNTFRGSGSIFSKLAGKKDGPGPSSTAHEGCQGA